MFDEEPDGDPHGECAAEIARLSAELEKCAAILPGTLYMDPPDGGDVSVSEQLRRMAQDTARRSDLMYAALWQIASNGDFTAPEGMKWTAIEALEKVGADKTANIKVSGPEAASSPEGRARLPGSTPASSGEKT